MATIFCHHTTCYLGDPYVIYLHLELLEDRNPKIIFLIKFACASPVWNHFYDHFHTNWRRTGVFETVNSSKPEVLSTLRGTPLCIEKPHTVPLFNRNQYSRTLLHVLAGSIREHTMACTPKITQSQGITGFLEASPAEIPWFLETAGFSESHRPSKTGMWRDRGFSECHRPKIPRWWYWVPWENADRILVVGGPCGRNV